jgi:hypothetical protein
MINLIINPIYTIIFYMLVIAGPQPIIYQFLDLNTGTPTSGLISQTPITTPGTPTVTSTPGPTASYTPTTTLMPLPAVTLIFPQSTNTPTVTNTPNNSFDLMTPEPNSAGETTSVPPRLRILSIVLVFLWIFLVGYLIIFIRQLF